MPCVVATAVFIVVRAAKSHCQLLSSSIPSLAGPRSGLSICSPMRKRNHEWTCRTSCAPCYAALDPASAHVRHRASTPLALTSFPLPLVHPLPPPLPQPREIIRRIRETTLCRAPQVVCRPRLGAAAHSVTLPPDYFEYSSMQQDPRLLKVSKRPKAWCE